MTLIEIVRELRDSGLDLRKGKFTSSGWSAYKIEKLGPYTILQYIPEDVYSGYSTGMGTQATSSAGVNKKGVIIELTDGTNIYHDQVFENTNFETQQVFWRQIISEMNRMVYPTSSYKKIGSQVMENPLQPSGESWRVGDIVNVSRPSHDSGGMVLGHVLRIYPTSVIVEWEPDALHPFAWTTQEEKTSLIFISHDSNYTKEKEFSAESYYHPLVNPRQTDYIENEVAIENEMDQKPPQWTEFVAPLGVELYRQTPLPKSQDPWGEMDSLMKYTNRVMSSMDHVNSLEKYTSKVLGRSSQVQADYGS